MTQISRDDVLHLASLSSLTLSDDEVELFSGDITRILEYVRLLDELDTSGVEPTYQLTDLTNVFRTDTGETSTIGRDTLLELAPEQQAHQIKVQKVL